MLKKSSNSNGEYVVVLPDIRSVYNVGAIFRTCDAVGVSKIILTGYTPTPIDRFGRERADFAKSALGSEKTVAWEYISDLGSSISSLREQGFTIVGIEQDARSIDYKTLDTKPKMAFVFGTETTGMTPELLNYCDAVVEIPMNGTKESLNVSVAAGIVLYRVLDK